MKARTISERVSCIAALDWDRRLFDALIPLPDGTTYNAYLVRGSEKTALIDTVDPPFTEDLLGLLDGVDHLEYIVSNHAEQDHSGALPAVLEKHPEATVLATPKGRGLLLDELHLPPDRVEAVDDGAAVSLGDRTLEFLHVPWVHWPDTMATYLREEKLLFSCDLFGSHLAQTGLTVQDEARVYEAAKRYYAEIMMPFRTLVRKHLDKLAALDIATICPSHGPLHARPAFILDAYREWTDDTPKNLVVLPYVSMHGSTRQMVEALVDALADRGVGVERFDLTSTDLGKLAIALVDAATVVIGTPTVLAGPHPLVVSAAYLLAALRPKLRFAAIIGSYGWGGKTVDLISGLIQNLKLDVLGLLLIKGAPRANDLEKLDAVADAIAEKHREAGLL